MKTASDSLKALLASNEFLFADLYTITLINGSVLRYTNADGALVYGGNTFANQRIERTSIKSSIGVNVDTMTVTIRAGLGDLINSVSFPQFATQGGFDGALVQLDRAFMSSFGNTNAGVVNLFFGRVSEVQPSRTSIDLTVSSMTELLNISMPRNLVSPGCIHNLYDSGCGLDQESFALSRSVTAISSPTEFAISGSDADGLFDAGKIIVTSGLNDGVVRSVKTFSSSTLSLAQPLPFELAVGDTLKAYFGCDKSKATCSAKFNNIIHFRGFPFVPVPTASM
ncbi:DUF2163 domain-containing protein [Limnobacter litoralis]|uniref:Bacteriophage phiJL001 Gp84 C-terminal domain-containing protein n=1 Tax=Limnobacter litoralis TaxID=481366 RepID=A0ABQ5YT08_9BURK|nr:DUF2163 domain-containing protein [Limnobacter litoralis]GLR26505.1 hypothetical protein GCM10007875_15950 [Limnobacter litoralis]